MNWSQFGVALACLLVVTTSFPLSRANSASGCTRRLPHLNAGKRPPPPPRPGAGSVSSAVGGVVSPQQSQEVEEAPVDMIKIRFVNGPNGKDIVHQAKLGANLMKEADEAGIYISRGCKSGLCGSCTCDLKDPAFVAADNAMVNNADGREGFQAIRACTTNVQLLPGQKEMVIDLWRMKDSGSEKADDPMSRFGEDWEKDFRPNTRGTGKGKGEIPDEDKDFYSQLSQTAPWDKVW